MSNETMEEIIMRKFKSIKKTVSVIITALFVLGAAACGSRNAEIGDAAYRAAGEGAGEFYIDNNAIYCNDRSIKDLGNWSSFSGGNTSIHFNQYDYPKTDLNCVNVLKKSMQLFLMRWHL